jgi:hypothetical protein
MSVKILAGVGLAVLALLWILGRIKSSESESSAAAVATPSASLDKWRASESKSPMDDSKTVTLNLKAENTIQGPLGEKRLSLIVRRRFYCTQGFAGPRYVPNSDIVLAVTMAHYVKPTQQANRKAVEVLAAKKDNLG